MSILICFFLALIPYVVPISFNFSNISQNNSDDIILSGNATYTPVDGIGLTDNRTWVAGRMTYNRPLHLWDNNSNLVSFSTSFTFVIDSYLKNDKGDGLAFFLARNNSFITTGATSGLPLDIPLTTFSPFVAVEFDTFGFNTWDPTYVGTSDFLGDHVGININSVTSVVSRKWYTNITYGKECRAMVNYFADSKTLSVSFTSFINSSAIWETGLNYTIDLRTVLPEWVIFGFSAATGDLTQKSSVRSWAFNSTTLKVDENNGNVGLKVGLISGTLFLVIVLAILACFLWRKKKNEGDKVEELGSNLEMNNELEIGVTIPRRFSYLELASSTDEFAKTKKLGEGGFGGVYKGFLKDFRKHVAVKRVSNTSNQGFKEFASEVRIISRLRHKNLVQLIGWCHDNDKRELLLAYELLENGSLDLHLFKGKSLLTWNTRYKIAIGLASALLYLHEEWEQCVLHRDIKSSNVMLDSNFNPKLGDFGLAKLVDHENYSDTTRVAGTIGYMAPEYATTGKASKESDVFSFGVVALEIACGRKPIDLHVDERKTNLVQWVWDLYGIGTLLEAADPCLGSNFAKEEMMCLMIVGLWCAHPDPKQRPSMKKAIQVLNDEVSFPTLPSNMPQFSLYADNLSSSSNKNS